MNEEDRTVSVQGRFVRRATSPSELVTEEFLSPRQAAYEFSVPERTILTWISRGWLESEATQHGQRKRHKVSRTAVRQVISEHQRGGVKTDIFRETRSLRTQIQRNELRMTDMLRDTVREYEKKLISIEKHFDEHERETEAQIAGLVAQVNSLANQLALFAREYETMRKKIE
jgi:hypothetical protein